MDCASSDPAAILWLVEAARIADDAFSMITGADLAYLDLEGENIQIPADVDLPWPDSCLISGWWDAHSEEFTAGKRYFAGRLVTRENLSTALREAKQRQRIAGAEELMLLKHGEVLFECRSPGTRNSWS